MSELVAGPSRGAGILQAPGGLVTIEVSDVPRLEWSSLAYEGCRNVEGRLL